MRVPTTQLLVFNAAAIALAATQFTPETDGYLANNLGNLATFYNVAESLNTLSAEKKSSSDTDSFWFSSFIHASNNRDYVVVGQVLGQDSLPDSNTLYRGSILDISDPSVYRSFTNFSNTDIFSKAGPLNASVLDFRFETLAAVDGIPVLHARSGVENIEYDITFELTSPALLNGGLGRFDGPNFTALQWSSPASRTSGWLSLNGENVTVDSERSSTWLDRQWATVPPAWYWFGLISDDGEGNLAPLSVWIWADNSTSTGLGGLATIREGAADFRVNPVVSVTNSTVPNPANNTGEVLAWTFELGTGAVYTATTARDVNTILQAPALITEYLVLSGTNGDGKPVTGYGQSDLVNIYDIVA